jgi:hypothetical protein
VLTDIINKRDYCYMFSSHRNGVPISTLYMLGYLPFCSIQGPVAAHWPPVALPTWPYADIPALCFVFPLYWEKRDFVNLVFLCAVCKQTTAGGAVNVVAGFGISGLGAWETGASFDTCQAHHFVTAKSRVEINGSLALVSQPDYSIVNFSDY